jgi:hypothetical protein
MCRQQRLSQGFFVSGSLAGWSLGSASGALQAFHPATVCHLLPPEAGELPLACLGNPDPAGMKVYCPMGKETFDDETTEEAPPRRDRGEAA